MASYELFSDLERLQFTQVPQQADERFLARYYSLNPDDISLINKHRGRINRLGFALQICYLRYPGRAFELGEEIPTLLLNYVANQLQIPPGMILEYARGRGATRREHLAEIMAHYGYKGLGDEQYQRLREWLKPIALSTENRVALMGALVEELRHRRLVLPTFSQLEKFAWEVCQQADQEIFELLTGKLTQKQKANLDELLQIPEDKLQTKLAWLRRPTGKTSPATFKKLTDRIEFIREFKLNFKLMNQLHQNRLTQLAREGSRITNTQLAQAEPIRRYAILVAFLLDLLQKLTDEALAMHIDLVGQLFNKSKRKHELTWQNNGKVLNEKVTLYAKVGKALIIARQDEADPYQAVEKIIDWSAFILSVVEAEELARPEDFDYLDLMNNHYSWVRQYSKKLLETFEFKAASNKAGKSLSEALKLLKELNEQKGGKTPAGAPTAFVKPRWQEYVFNSDGSVDRHYYEFCALSSLRDALKSGDIWVESSLQFRNFSDYLLPVAEWLKLREAKQVPLPIETDFVTYMSERTVLLHDKLWELHSLIKSGQLPRVTLENGEFHLGKMVKEEEPENLEKLKELEKFKRMVYGLLPKVRITDLLVEIDELTGFSRHFTHQQSGQTAPDKIALLAAILADGLNLDLDKMADASAGLSYRQLAWAADWHIRGETYRKALAELVNFQHKLPFAANFGQGKSSSSDGQRFPVGGVKEAGNKINLKYGFEPGIMFYTHISDQYAPYYIQVIRTTVRQAPFMINGLLYHESELEIETHHTDTHGYTDQIFGAASLLGFKFQPRIQDIGDKRLYCIGTASNYPAISELISDKINSKVIGENWEELLRLFTSIKKGTVTASLILGKLAAYPRQHRLAQALRELGRLEKTLFTIEWIKDEALQRGGQSTLNKGESRNSLARTLFYHRLGEVRERNYQDQLNRASGLTLLSAAIVAWNTLYLEKAVELLRQQGEDVSEEKLKRLSPLSWHHINLTGDYIWKLKQGFSLDNLRPLRTRFGG